MIKASSITAALCPPVFGVALAVAVFGWLMPSPTLAEGEVKLERLDRIVAVVDEDPIFASDLARAAQWSAGAGPPGSRSGSGSISARLSDRELLDQLIDERVRVHEVDRHGSTVISRGDIDPYLEAVPPGVDRAEAESLIRRQLRVLAYVEERLGALVFVSDDAVRAYYDDTLREQMLRQGQSLPPFEDVQDAIRTLLREQGLDERIVSWTEELRQRAVIVDYLDDPLPLDPLPPVRLTIREPPGP